MKTPRAYYNEIDLYCAEWLYNLQKENLIAPGDIDTRPIQDVRPNDLKGYTQHHFFAGIGIWSAALRQAHWPDDREIWTGSCPCQPFSAAGKRGGVADDRHLWPWWKYLIAQCRPVAVVGEQVASKDGLSWLDIVQTDLENTNYASGAIDLCAAGVGAPHIRQRLWFMAYPADQRRQQFAGNGPAELQPEAHGPQGRVVQSGNHGSSLGILANANGRDANGRDASAEGLQRSGQHGFISPNSGTGEQLAHAHGSRRRARRASETGNGRDAPRIELAGLCAAGELGDTTKSGSFSGASPGLHRGEESARPRDAEFERPSSDCELGNTSGAGLALGSIDQDGRGAVWDQGQTAPAPGPANGFWRDAEWIPCTDGKARPVEAGTFPLAYGDKGRVGKLRAYGNAINQEVAQAFIKSVMDILQ
jgi:DNA (cytosine-5)-methyltransferase 1